jgi:hypothetical protein
MNSFPLLLATAVVLPATVGCAAPGPRAQAHFPARWEVVELAEGVELRVRQDASPGAKSAADQVVVQYESGYLNAR